jgi:hypothetical protein
LTEDFPDNGRLVEELYLAFLSRLPEAWEMEAGQAHLSRAGKARRPAVEDLAWALLNSGEFLFNH